MLLTLNICLFLEGWKKLKFGKCKQYFLASAKKSHADAVADCKAKGAILFEPKSELTNTWVAELALEEGISGYWIGITDKKFEGKFVYQSDSKSIGLIIIVQHIIIISIIN